MAEVIELQDRQQGTPVPLNEYAKRLGVKPSTVEKWAALGEVRIWQPGGKGGKKFVIAAN